jgi:maltose-binding protein MalE
MAVQAAFARQIPYLAYMPRIPFFFEFQTEFDTAIEKALRGSASPQAALDVAAANVNTSLARERALLLAVRGSGR